MKVWNNTEAKPGNDRFVMLVLRDGEEREAQYTDTQGSLFRKGKDWLGRGGKYADVALNPAVSWRELQPWVDMNGRYDGKLWCDLENDLERSEFIACGRAHETGIIAPAICKEVAQAFMTKYEAEILGVYDS